MNRQALLNKYPQIDWRDRQLILAHILNISREELIAHSNKTVSIWHQFKYWWAIKKRKNSTPLAYILGKQPFYGLEFFVNRHTLIPRPETEQLVDMALEIIREKNIQTVIDVGTGSGAIAISVAKHAPNVRIIVTDISQPALKMARKNAEANNTEIHFLLGSLFKPYLNIRNPKTKTRELIVANLPYLNYKTYKNTEPQVKKEPELALIGGDDGLKYYRELIKQINKIEQTPICIFECDPTNAQRLKKECKEAFPKMNPEIINDFNNLNRFVVIK